MNSIFNRHGKIVAWIQETEIFDLKGRSIDFVNNEAVFNLRAAYKGTFSNGFFRDKNGSAVAFIDGSTNGPIPPIPSLNWSSIDWNAFIG
ncbi:hypothetical protein JYB64_01805 [Algoriphagus aestuarii]|nr:hypothetical protein [Algoriphagus aestuarii]